MMPDKRGQPKLVKPALSPEQVREIIDLLRRLVEALEKGKP